MLTNLGSKTSSGNLWFLRTILLLVFLFLLTRLVELQVIKGDYYVLLSEENRVRRLTIPARRGDIVSKSGETIAGSIQIMKRVHFEPDEGYSLSDDITDAKEDELVTTWMRDYKAKEAVGNITGYLGEAKKDEVGKIRPGCNEKGPVLNKVLLGRGGLEEYYECLLSGYDGEELVEVDASGKKVRTLGTREPIPGQDLEINLHLGLQKKVVEFMNGLEGSVIVSKPNGEILSIYSSPSFDPNAFIRNNQEELEKILNGANNPLFDRSIKGRFHPGSIFKPLVAIGALEEGSIDTGYRFVDEGVITLKTLYGTYTYKNWYFTQYGGTEGEVGIEKALARSTDTFFYKVGELLGVERIALWSRKFGLEEKTGIDLPGEWTGLVPDPEWKEREKNEKWFLGNTYHYAIGQGDLAVTPIGIHAALSSIANNGVWCKPHLSGSEECKNLEIDQTFIDVVKEGMNGACNEGGTAFPFFDYPKSLTGENLVACKTGTAQTEEIDKTHAWFFAFSPIENPDIVVTILVEKGGEGSQVAAPIARQIFDYWYGFESVEKRKLEEQKEEQAVIIDESE